MTACPYCGDQLTAGEERFGYLMGSCRSCGSVACMDDVTEADLARLYGHPEYYCGGCSPYGYDGDFVRADAQRAPVWEERLAAVSRVADGDGGRLLEVGPGTGGFLRFARARGWDVLGLEPYPAEGLDEPVVADADAARDQGPYRAICLFDVLEHLLDPAAVLSGLVPLLAPGGCIVVGLPSAGGHSFRRHRFRWVEVRPPEHLSLPTPAGMRALFVRTGLVEAAVLGHHRHTWQAEAVRRGLVALTGRVGPMAAGARLGLRAVGRAARELRLRLPAPAPAEQDYVTWVARRAGP